MTPHAHAIAPVAAPLPRIGSRDRVVYLAIALLGVIAVFLANAAITRFVAERAPGGAVALLFILPLLVVLTRPLQVTPGHRTRRTERALAIVYALRERRWRILFSSIAIVIVWLLFIGGLSLLLYSFGLYQATSAVANWLYVSAAAMLIWNLMPGRFHLRPAKPYTVCVIAATPGAASMYAGLVALDRGQKGWQMATAESGDRVVEQVHAALAGGGDPPPLQSARVYFTWPRLWSRLTGDRAVPVDLVGTSALPPILGRRCGVVALATDDLLRDGKALVRFFDRELRYFKDTHPSVAVVVREDTPEARDTIVAAADRVGIKDYEIFRAVFDRDIARRNVKETNAATPLAWLLTRPPIRIPRRKRP